MKLDAVVNDVTNIESITVSDAHNSPTSTAALKVGSTTLIVGDPITVELGYDGVTTKVFEGFVKQIDKTVPDNTLLITAQNIMIKAVEFFIASSTPDNPFTRFNISAEDLVEDLLDLADITNYVSDTSNFTFAIFNPMEINLISSFDICKTIADILAYSVWADRDGVAHFEDRRPNPMGGDSSIATIDSNTVYNIIGNTYRKSDRDLRNRIVVYGAPGITAVAEAESPHLPTGYRKTVVVASQWIDSQSMAQDAADFNLDKLNRLTEEVAVEVIGDPVYDARKVLTIDEDFTGVDGDWYIFSVEHKWSSAGYLTSMELRR
jgi:hypothetical protein